MHISVPFHIVTLGLAKEEERKGMEREYNIEGERSEK